MAPDDFVEEGLVPRDADVLGTESTRHMGSTSTSRGTSTSLWRPRGLSRIPDRSPAWGACAWWCGDGRIHLGGFRQGPRVQPPAIGLVEEVEEAGGKDDILGGDGEVEGERGSREVGLHQE